MSPHKNPSRRRDFPPRGEPEILHRADRAAEVHVGLVGSPQPDRVGAVAVTGNADPDRRLDDAFQLEPAIGSLLVVPR